MEIKDRVEEAILAFALGEDEKAESSLLDVVKEAPSSVDALRALSEVSLSMGKVEQAEPFCRSALEECPDDLSLMVTLSRILVRKGDKEGAEEAAAKARILGWKEELAEDGTTT